MLVCRSLPSLSNEIYYGQRTNSQHTDISRKHTETMRKAKVCCLEICAIEVFMKEMNGEFETLNEVEEEGKL